MRVTPPDFEGLLLGTAVGDALGLPREGLTPARATKFFGPPPLRHALLPGTGLTSDDTDHAILTAKALLACHGDPARFGRALAWRLRLWLLTLPPGIGLATARACIKLLLGFPPTRSGVQSAGNGAAMRAPIIGAYAHDDLPLLKQLIRVSTHTTHTHPAAEHGALAIALAITLPDPTPTNLRALVEAHLPEGDTRALLLKTCDALTRGETFATFLLTHHLARGISGYINHTAPAVLFCYLQHPRDYEAALTQLITAGGDTDTTAALLGALIAAHTGPAAIPTPWLTGLRDLPHTKPFLNRLAHALSASGPPPCSLYPVLLLRNLFALVIILLHGFRRLLPPY